MSKEAISRRDFLKLGIGATAGIAAIEVFTPVLGLISEEIKKNSDQNVGNASFSERVRDSCEPDQTIDECVDAYVQNPENQIRSIVQAPISEEFIFRAIPSEVLSTFDMAKDDIDNMHNAEYKVDNPFLPIKEVITGTEEFTFTRRELVVGVVSSVLFGYAHNMTKEGFSTKTVPVYQLGFGMIFWYLQRRFGILANTGAHAWVNYSAYFRWK